jgi:hypothetical protein
MHKLGLDINDQAMIRVSDHMVSTHPKKMHEVQCFSTF